MKIYISEKENIDLSKNCFLTFSTKDEQAVDWNVLAQSLEQHEEEIRNQERQNVIAEMEEWVDKQPKATYWLNYNESEKHLSAESLKQKLKEMKEV